MPHDLHITLIFSPVAGYQPPQCLVAPVSTRPIQQKRVVAARKDHRHLRLSDIDDAVVVPVIPEVIYDALDRPVVLDGPVGPRMDLVVSTDYSVSIVSLHGRLENVSVMVRASSPFYFKDLGCVETICSPHEPDAVLVRLGVRVRLVDDEELALVELYFLHEVDSNI